MPKLQDDTLTAAILEVLHGRAEGASFGEIAEHVGTSTPSRTVQYRLKGMVEAGRLTTTGAGRWMRYYLRGTEKPKGIEPSVKRQDIIPLSDQAKEIQRYIRQAQAKRRPVGYDRTFLDGYRPNKGGYLTESERHHLAGIGEQGVTADAGTYAKQILNRLLIDLSWNSSRLEGNTYSLADTERLIEFGHAAGGLTDQETQMILNHRDAIEFLVNSADEIRFDNRSILNLHALLANNLLSDSAAAGRLRFIGVGISGSVFHPLEGPQLIRESFEQVLRTAAAIDDPFEQALFLLVQLPYLQPFDDVNKRVSRLAANIPFVKRNLSPLSFTDVPADLYREAVLAVYELKNVALLKELFIWSYERSADRYRAVRQSLGEPDPLKLQYRNELRDIVAQVIRSQVDRLSALDLVRQRTRNDIPEADRDAFAHMVETELTTLHEGNFARYSVRPSEFDAWQQIWNASAPKS